MVGVPVVAVQPEAAVVRQQVAQQRQALIQKLQVGALVPGIGVLRLLLEHGVGA